MSRVLVSWFDEIPLACVGPVGKLALATAELSGFNIVRAITRIRLRPEFSRRYFDFAMSTAGVQVYFSAATRTVSQPTLNVKQVGETELLCPPINDQRKFEMLACQAEATMAKHVSASHDNGRLIESLTQRAFAGRL